MKLKSGTNLQDIIKNIFKTLIKDEILMLYSWKGARGKNAFQSFKIVSLIIGKRFQNMYSCCISKLTVSSNFSVSFDIVIKMCNQASISRNAYIGTKSNRL